MVNPGYLLSPPLRTMNSTANQPATVQPMVLEDSDISPISFPENKGRKIPWKFSNFARAFKRGAKPMSPKVLPAHKGGRGEQDQDAGSAFLHATQQRVEIPLDQSDRKAIEALMEQIRHNEAYVA